jgi:hypothetical protein
MTPKHLLVTSTGVCDRTTSDQDVTHQSAWPLAHQAIMRSRRSTPPRERMDTPTRIRVIRPRKRQRVSHSTPDVAKGERDSQIPLMAIYQKDVGPGGWAGQPSRYLIFQKYVGLWKEVIVLSRCVPPVT